MYQKLVVVALIFFVATGCQKSKQSEKSSVKGFNAEASDAKAMAIADSVMEAMGGQENWDNTRVISWTFLGRRTHTWDKQKGEDRVVIPEARKLIIVNLDTRKGMAMKTSKRITQPDSLKKELQKGYEMWVNDAYWLVMPYKLKDPGVTLKYMGTDTTQAGIPSYKLKLTFDEVGMTPQNKYYVYVDTTDYLVRQWAYFSDAANEEPDFVQPWDNYKKYGNILLSGDRGKYSLTNIKVR